jgi:hypothetical protein
VSAEPLESRIAHMEGVNVQIADRLNGIDGRLDSLDRSLRSEIGGVRSEIGDLRSEMNARFGQVDQKFMWVIGIIFTSWTTTIATIFLHH